MERNILRATICEDPKNGVYFYCLDKVKEEKISPIMRSEVKIFYSTPFKGIWRIPSDSWFGGWAFEWQYS